MEALVKGLFALEYHFTSSKTYVCSYVQYRLIFYMRVQEWQHNTILNNPIVCLHGPCFLVA